MGAMCYILMQEEQRCMAASSAEDKRLSDRCKYLESRCSLCSNAIYMHTSPHQALRQIPRPHTSERPLSLTPVQKKICSLINASQPRP